MWKASKNTLEIQSAGLLTNARRKVNKFTRQLLLSALVFIPLLILRPLERLDIYWSDLLLARQQAVIPSNILVVSITPDDVISNGMERLSRKYLASTLTLLAEANVNRILLDFNMARASTPEEESAVLDALKRLGPKRVGFAYDSKSASRPGEMLLPEASVLNLTLNPDYDGRIRSIEASQERSIPNPCIWLSSGEMSIEQTALDLRYDPKTIRRVSLSELHSGKIPNQQLANNLVIIANTRELSRTRSNLPLHGSTDRGSIFAIGTASFQQGFSTSSAQAIKIMSVFSATLTLLSFYVGYRTANVSKIFASLFRLVALVMFACWCGTYLGGVPTKPATLVLNSGMIICVCVADRLRVFELFKGLMSGVLSPEEVWVWRTFGDRNSPAILFDGMGYIKKANSAALLEFQLDLKTLNHQVTDLAKKSMPSLGERCSRLVLEAAARKVWDVEWPSKHLPLAIFTDVTEQTQKLELLHSQLTTDPLTGALNRKGFELTIQSIDQQQARNYTVFFMDMNGFKAVNDRYGHGAGDMLLRVAAQRFREAISEQDYVARFGGDEFAIIVPQRLSPEEALAVRDCIESTLTEKIDVGEALVQVGVAAGFAVPVDDDEPLEKILERADLEMYSRKAFLKRSGLASGTISGDRTEEFSLQH
jgi:diguanylate cyclase (GGDEF)-like protein